MDTPVHSGTTQHLIDTTLEIVEDVKDRPKKPWQLWIDAELGLRNYWYPAALSRHVAERGSHAIKLLGEDILLTRQNGKVFAVEDRCPHRGVPFSKRPLYYTKETLTCWYHTFTFGLKDGQLRTILNEPTSPLIGKCKIKSYPVEERKGIIFVFVGDIEPPPVEADVPPGFLDEDSVIYATDPYEINANWRLACENGYDPGHHFVHNWSRLAIDAGLPMTYGWVSTKEGLAKTVKYETNEPGPKGFTRYASETKWAFEAKIPLEDGSEAKITLPLAKGKTKEELDALTKALHQTTVGLWLPCGLKVHFFPRPPVIHYEFYVPKDEKTHTYFQFGVIHTSDSTEAEAWLQEYGYFLHEVPVKGDFTVDDAFARQGMQKFYSEEDGWYRERLYRPDIELTMWRKFVTEQARGVQTRDHAKGLFKR